MNIRGLIDVWIRDERIYSPFGSSSDDWLRDSERMERCEDAATDGCDGSTHGEIIEDMRTACLEHVTMNRPRLYAAVDAYFDDLAAWHHTNGTLHQQVG